MRRLTIVKQLAAKFNSQTVEQLNAEMGKDNYFLNMMGPGMQAFMFRLLINLHNERKNEELKSEIARNFPQKKLVKDNLGRLCTDSHTSSSSSDDNSSSSSDDNSSSSSDDNFQHSKVHSSFLSGTSFSELDDDTKSDDSSNVSLIENGSFSELDENSDNHHVDNSFPSGSSSSEPDRSRSETESDDSMIKQATKRTAFISSTEDEESMDMANDGKSQEDGKKMENDGCKHKTNQNNAEDTNKGSKRKKTIGTDSPKTAAKKKEIEKEKKEKATAERKEQGKTWQNRFCL